MIKKVLLVIDEKSLVENSGSWKYIFNFTPFFKWDYELEILHKPESCNFITWWYRRLIKLPRIINEKYKNYTKLFYSEHYLPSIRKSFIDDTVIIIHHYTYLIKTKTIKDFIVKILSYITFNTVLKKIKRIVVVSKETEKVLLWLWINKKYITYIPNCIDISEYKEISSEEKKQLREKLSTKYKIPKNKKRLLYVGTNESRKNLSTLFNVLWKLDDQYILLRVWRDIDNDGKKIEDDIIKKYNLSSRYFHLQDISEEELISVYQTSDIYITSSLFEWFGRPIIEAQACWCPVISTKCWALEEVCWEWALLVNDPFDCDEYIEKIKELDVKRDYLVKKWKENSNKYSNETNSKLLLNLFN